MSTVDERRPGEADFLDTTRTAYDTLADSYAAQFDSEMAGLPIERALLTAFAELAGPVGPIADIGCGPGHVTAYLRSRGVDVSGVDLSPAMVAAARRAYPQIGFEVGSMTALDRPDGGLGGVLAMYSIIHIPPAELPSVIAEFRRVLAPGGWALFFFQIGEITPRLITDWLGHEVRLEQHRHAPDRVAELLAANGFAVRAQMVRHPDGVKITVPRASILAQVLQP